MLNFFEQQAQARRRTVALLTLYILGVCLFVIIVTPVLMAFLVVFVNLATRGKTKLIAKPIADFTELITTSPMEIFTRPEGQIFWVVGFSAAMLLVFGASAIKASTLRASGGQGIAESLGGQLVVHSDNMSLDKKRLLNVVEEMAIASGTPVPPVYVLPDEDSINAFAAGYTPSDAVIAVTRGAARSLTREQLQGVIAHEFSHILNGDMRLNIRLIGLLFGIVVVQMLGKTLLEMPTSRAAVRGKDSGALILVVFMVFGLLLVLLGFIGSLIAKFIKAMISRQCEYRADAAAVQFTRNPEGLAQALQVVGGTRRHGFITHSNAEECSHLFFVGGVSGFLATAMDSHPPLKSRIRRLDPSWDGTWLKPIPEPVTDPYAHSALNIAGSAGLLAGTSALVAHEYAHSESEHERAGNFVPEQPTYTLAAATGYVGSLTPHAVFQRITAAKQVLRDIPADLLAVARDAHDARALLLSMLLDSQSETRLQQLDVITRLLGINIASASSKYDDSVQAMRSGLRMPLLEVALSAMASLSRDQYSQFRLTVEELSRLDASPTFFQTCIQHMLIVHLDRRFGLVPPPITQYYVLTRLGEECSTLFSAAAMVAGQGAEDAAPLISRLGEKIQAPNTRRLKTIEITPARIHQSLTTLATASTQCRMKLVNACAEIIGHDGKVTTSEAELLRVIADSLQIPIALQQ